MAWAKTNTDLDTSQIKYISVTIKNSDENPAETLAQTISNHVKEAKDYYFLYKMREQESLIRIDARQKPQISAYYFDSDRRSPPDPVMKGVKEGVKKAVPDAKDVVLVDIESQKRRSPNYRNIEPSLPLDIALKTLSGYANPRRVYGLFESRQFKDSPSTAPEFSKKSSYKTPGNRS